MPKTSLYDTVTELNTALASASSPEQRNAIARRFRLDGKFGRRRFLVGEANGNSDVTLDDADGHPRLQLRVTPKGVATIAFLADDGRAVKTISADQP